MKEPPEPPPDPAEELLKEGPELGTFGVEWVRKWLVLRDRLVEIAKVLRKFPWMVEVVRQRPMSILNPYMAEAYVARDGVGGVSLPKPAEDLLRAGRSREGDKAGAGVQQILDIRRQDERGVQTKGAIGVRRGGQGIREDTLGETAKQRRPTFSPTPLSPPS